jgi:hypothetical protein
LPGRENGGDFRRLRVGIISVIPGAVKTAISIPDQVFRDAERMAKRLKLSRSELYRKALEAFMRSLRDRDIKESYDRAFAAPESGQDLRFRRRAAREALQDVEWKD